jgi:hypothetical protein
VPGQLCSATVLHHAVCHWLLVTMHTAHNCLLVQKFILVVDLGFAYSSITVRQWLQVSKEKTALFFNKTFEASGARLCQAYFSSLISSHWNTELQPHQTLSSLWNHHISATELRQCCGLWLTQHLPTWSLQFDFTLLDGSSPSAPQTPRTRYCFVVVVGQGEAVLYTIGYSEASFPTVPPHTSCDN